MSIHFIGGAFRLNGKFVGKNRGLKSSIARKEYYKYLKNKKIKKVKTKKTKTKKLKIKKPKIVISPLRKKIKIKRKFNKKITIDEFFTDIGFDYGDYTDYSSGSTKK